MNIEVQNHLVNKDEIIPLYLIDKGQGEENLELVYAKKIKYTSLNNLTEKHKQELPQKCNNMELQESYRPIFLTDLELLIFNEQISFNLTDGIIDYLRNKYQKGKYLMFLSDEQKQVYENFIIRPSQFVITILKYNMPFNKQEFRNTYFISSEVKIGKKTYQDNTCDIFLEYQRFGDYFTSLRYFLQQKLVVLNTQRYNRTREILKVLMYILQIDKKNKEENQCKININSIETSINSLQSTNLNEGQIFTSNQESLFAQQQLQVNKDDHNRSNEIEKIYELEIQNNIKTNFQAESSKDITQNKITSNILQNIQNNENVLNSLLQSQNKLEIEQKSIKAMNPEENKTENDNDIMKTSYINQHDLKESQNNFEIKIQEKIEKIRFIMNQKPKIKQTITLDKQQYTIKQILDAFCLMNDNITQSRQQNEEIDNIQIKKFFLKFKEKTINNLLSNIIKDCKIDMSKFNI